MARAVGTRIVRKQSDATRRIEADICVVGSGAAGISAAVEAARGQPRRPSGDSARPRGQAVNAIIGTFCGLYSNGPDIRRLTYGIADEILDSLYAAGAARDRPARNSMIVQYDEVALARWVDRTVRDAGITVLLGATVRDAETEGDRVSPPRCDEVR